MKKAISSLAPAEASIFAGLSFANKSSRPQKILQRQIAVAFVVAVEEPAFLLAMDGIVGRVEIEDDALRRRGLAFEKQTDEQLFHRALHNIKLAIAVVIALWRVLKPVQRRLSRQHSAIGTASFSLARNEAENGSWRSSS